MTDGRGNILITGASGMIGSALSEHLEDLGYRCFALHRDDNNAPFHYDQNAEELTLSTEIPLRAVINLAGANLADGRWTASRKRLILESRRETTRRLSAAMSALPRPPELFLSASAVGFYGDTGAQTVDENDANGDGFLARVSLEWEEAAALAAAQGIRTVIMRLGLVLSADGGILDKFVLPMGLAAVGRVGDGRHYMSWISLRDVLSTVASLLEHPDAAGPINLVSNSEVTNDEFTRCVASALGRPRLPPLPAPVVRLLFGEMGDEALLGSNRVRTRRLEELGITLQDQALAATLERLLD